MLTVSHLIESFLAHIQVLVSSGSKKPATYQFYRWQLPKLKTAAGSVPADALRPYHLAGVQFTYHFVRACKALYRWATDEELVPRDPFKKIKTPRCGQRKRVLTRKEMTSLYLAARPPFRRFLMACRYTLARPKELRDLRWAHVHLEARAIVLTEFKAQDQRSDGAEVRVIPLAQPLVRLLGNLKRQQCPSPNDHVFQNRYGKPLSASALRSAMLRARGKAGLNEDGIERIVCYSLRHTGATEATRAGVRDNLLARILGHTNTRTTQRYQHLDCADLVNGIDVATARRRSAG